MEPSLNHDQIKELLALISKNRLDGLPDDVHSDSDRIYAHQGYLKTGSALIYVIATIEIALRNAIFHNLKTFFGDEKWLYPDNDKFSWKKNEIIALKKAAEGAQREKYTKLSQSQKHKLDDPQLQKKDLTHREKVKNRQKQLAYSADNLITCLTFYFWKRVLSRDYEKVLWDRSLKKIFPNKSLSRAVVANHIENIYNARNRIAHHELVIGQRLDQTIDSISFIITNLTPHNVKPESGLKSLLAADMQAILTQKIT